METYEEFFENYDEAQLLVIDTDELDYRKDPAALDRVCRKVLDAVPEI